MYNIYFYNREGGKCYLERHITTSEKAGDLLIKEMSRNPYAPRLIIEHINDYETVLIGENHEASAVVKNVTYTVDSRCADYLIEHGENGRSYSIREMSPDLKEIYFRLCESLEKARLEEGSKIY